MHRHKHVEKLVAYKPVPLSAAANPPQTLIVWAQNGTRDLEKDPEPDFTTRKMILEELNDGSWILGLSLVLMDGTRCFPSPKWC